MQSSVQYTLLSTFGLGSDAVEIEGRAGGAPKNPNYVFQPLLLKKLLAWHAGITHRNLMLIGETGCGKSSVIEEIAARLGLPIFSTACSGDTRFESLVGSLSLENGTTMFKDGPLTAAMRVGGIFLANEITRMNAGEQMRLADVLDKGGKLTIPETGEVVIPHPDFRFAATGNSGGFGDDTGAYAGERNASLAFRNRFNVLRMKPLDQSSEEQMLAAACPSIPYSITEKIGIM